VIRIAALLLASAAMLAGCGGSADRSGGGEGGGIRMANEHHDALLKLSPGYQRLAMLRALRDNNYTRRHCLNVDNAGYQEEYRNMRMWVAECSNDERSFAVFIAPNGDVQVRDCADAGTLSLPRCNGLPPPEPDSTLPQVKEGASDNAYKARPRTPEAP
jgi:hypothetical protein